MLKHQNITETRRSKAYNLRMIPCNFCLHRFALSTNQRITPAEISRYRLISMSVLLISRQTMKLQISFGFARAMPTTNPQTGMLWERDWEMKRISCLSRLSLQGRILTVATVAYATVRFFKDNFF